MRTLGRWLFKAIIALTLMVGFYMLWCDLYIRNAIAQGALDDNPGICFDVRHLELKRAGHVPLRTVDTALIRGIWMYSNERGRLGIAHHAMLFSLETGWHVFWSRQERRAIYEKIEPQMRPCPGAVEKLKERDAQRRGI